MREKPERGREEKEGSARANGKKKTGYFHHLDQVTTSFFITNFPAEATTGDLWKLFQNYGRVGEVYIPKKLDKRGRRFGFVKFKEVEDAEMLSDQLRDVWCGSFKLWVNLSRFRRSDRDEASQQTIPNRSDVQLEDSRSGKSFKTALVGRAPSMVLKTLHVPVNEELCKELRGSVVGLLAREKDVTRIQTTLAMEGFRSISVTHMGGNMALLRSSMEGDVDRLLKRKNECLSFYFSELKPWNPGLLAVQREVWVQAYGIPLHIWGETFFKQIGNNLGEFLDFDEETARLARFDVARIKIRTSTWGSIDVVQKVVVEEAGFDVWIVEERGRNRSVVVMNEEVEEEGSYAAPVGISDYGDDNSGGGADFSGDDEESGAEFEVDGREMMQKGGRHEVEYDKGLGEQVPKQGNVSLTCEKSTNDVISQEEIPSVPVDNMDIEEKACGQSEKEEVLAVSTKADDIGDGGPQVNEEPIFLNKVVTESGPHVGNKSPGDVAGCIIPLSDPATPTLIGPAQDFSDPPFLGKLVEEGVERVSSVSEPVEVLAPHRSKISKDNPKARKHKACSNFKQLGVPTCIKLAEAVKEVGPRAKKKRQKEMVTANRVVVSGGRCDDPVGGNTMQADDGRLVGSGGRLEECDRRQGGAQQIHYPGSTPASGLLLLSGSDISRVSDSLSHAHVEDRDKLIEAAKLLNIQKDVGFTFVEATEDTLKHLVDQEICDRAKKLEWEKREGDQ
jgi:hypothetical protein